MTAPARLDPFDALDALDRTPPRKPRGVAALDALDAIDRNTAKAVFGPVGQGIGRPGEGNTTVTGNYSRSGLSQVGHGLSMVAGRPLASLPEFAATVVPEAGARLAGVAQGLVKGGHALPPGMARLPGAAAEAAKPSVLSVAQAASQPTVDALHRPFAPLRALTDRVLGVPENTADRALEAVGNLVTPAVALGALPRFAAKRPFLSSETVPPTEVVQPRPESPVESSAAVEVGKDLPQFQSPPPVEAQAAVGKAPATARDIIKQAVVKDIGPISDAHFDRATAAAASGDMEALDDVAYEMLRERGGSLMGGRSTGGDVSHVEAIEAAVADFANRVKAAVNKATEVPRETSVATPAEPAGAPPETSAIQEGLFGVPSVAGQEQGALFPTTAGIPTAKLKDTKIGADEMARVTAEGPLAPTPAGPAPMTLFPPEPKATSQKIKLFEQEALTHRIRMANDQLVAAREAGAAPLVPEDLPEVTKAAPPAPGKRKPIEKQSREELYQSLDDKDTFSQTTDMSPAGWAKESEHSGQMYSNSGGALSGHILQKALLYRDRVQLELIRRGETLDEIAVNLDAYQMARDERLGIEMGENVKEVDMVRAGAHGFHHNLPFSLGNERGMVGPLYHGSPHKFEQFDINKIGTGEGAQAYGHGLYFSENPEVARGYRKALTSDVGRFDFDETGMSPQDVLDLKMGANLQMPGQDIGFAVRQARGFAEQFRAIDPERSALFNASATALEKYGDRLRPAGATYTAELPDAEADDFLHWDKPLSAQSPTVQRAVRTVLTDLGVDPERITASDLTGRETYAYLSDQLAGNAGMMPRWARAAKAAPDASRVLRAAGVPGVKYLDQGSRQTPALRESLQRMLDEATSEGDTDTMRRMRDELRDLPPETHNYAVFHHDDLRILNREGAGALKYLTGLTGAGAGATVGAKTDKEHPLRGALLGAVAGAAIGHSGGKAIEDYGPKIGDAFRTVFAPASRGPEAGRGAGIIRAETGQMARENEQAIEALKGFRAQMGKLPVAARFQFIDDVEHGRPQASPKLQQAANAIRRELDATRDQVRALGTGKLAHFYEDYFPHLWEDPVKAEAVVGQILGKRPLQGPASFLKQRSIPTIAEGMAPPFNLKPVSDNPVDLVLLKLREMKRYVMGQRVLQGYKDAGLAKLVPYADAPSAQTALRGTRNVPPPPGWQRINDKIARAGSAGQYWAPEPAARVLNNYLSPGLRGNALYDAYTGLGNTLNQAQLGLSAFHLGFTSMDAAVSKDALAIMQLASGHPLKAAGSFVEANVAPISNFMRGSKVRSAYLDPSKADPRFARLAAAVAEAGGRVKMDSFYKTGAVDAFRKALAARSPLGVVWHGARAALEQSSRPVLEWIVPRQKLGVFADLAEHELSRLPATATDAERQAVLGRAWDSVDNRMGQLVYDNLFWNKTLKDVSMASVRSVGWNLGTIRELGGGAADLARGRITPKAAYVIALPARVALMGAVLNYLYTGEGPKSFKDYFFPRTGRLNPDGNEERVQLPSYMKDVFAYAKHPVATIGHKLHPALSAVSDMLNNETFYGDMIRNPDDPLVKQMQQVAAFVGEQFVPFGIRNAQEEKARGQGMGEIAPTFAGLTPAKREDVRTPAQNQMQEYLARRGQSVRTPEQSESAQGRRDLRQQLRAGTITRTQLADSVRAGALTRRQDQTMVRMAAEPATVSKFKQLTLPEAERVYAMANSQEQALWLKALQYKRRSGHLLVAQGVPEAE